MFSDAHLHILDVLKRLEKEKQASEEQDGQENLSSSLDSFLDKIFMQDIAFCASADSHEVFEEQEELCQKFAKNFILSFGIHPQNPVDDELAYLEKLIQEKRIKAIGECGFDLFNDEFKAIETEQKYIWKRQAELAVQYSLPMVIHCRKALHLLFNELEMLKKMPSVIFHGWAGSLVEANSFLKKGVNAYFCIGKGLLRRQKAQIQVAQQMELSRLLTETDAPYMCLKEQNFSLPVDIKLISEELVKTRSSVAGSGKTDIAIKERDEFYSIICDKIYDKIYENFKRAYFL